MQTLLHQLQPELPGSLTRLAEITRQTLETQLTALDNASFRLRISRPRERMHVRQGMHFHQMPELFIQISGITDFKFPGEIVRVMPGELCLVPRGLPHGETVKGWQGPFLNLVFMYQQGQVHYHLATERPSGSPQMLIGNIFVSPQAQRLAEYLDHATEYYFAGTSWGEAALKGVMSAHLAGLLAGLELGGSSAAGESLKISQARQLVMNHLGDPELSVARLAEWIRCTPDYLSYLFHKECGAPLSLYINEQRIAYARHLLEFSHLNISEIALAVGFADPGYFTRVFRKLTHRTPKDYRHSLKTER